MRGEMSPPEKLLDQIVKEFVEAWDELKETADSEDFKIIFERYDRALDKFRGKDADSTK
jgi:hypothetical protein